MSRTVIPTIVLTLALGGAATASAQSAEQCFLGATASRYGDGGRVQGNVGTNDAGGLLQAGRRFVVEAGSVASADTVRLGPGSQVAETAANALDASRATVGKEGPVTLPLVAEFCLVPAFACGGQVVTVRKGKSLTLPPGSYGTVELQNGADLVLGPGIYEFCTLRGGRRATIFADAATVLNVQGALALGNGSRLGNGTLATVNVGGDQVKLGAKSRVAAILAAPAAVLDLGRGVEWRGRFCAAEVKGGPRLKLDCDGTPTTTTTTTTTTTSTTTTTEPTTTTSSTTTTTTEPTTTTTTSTTSTTEPTTTTTTTSTTMTTTTSSTTTTTSAPTTTTSTTSTTSTTVAPTTTSTTTSTTAPPTTTTTTTTVPPPLMCGTSNFLDVTATLVYDPRIVGGVFGMFLEVDYPAAVSIPGSGTESTARARFTNLIGTNYRVVPSDIDSNGDLVDDRGRTLVTANTSEAVPSAAIQRIQFDCPSGTVVQPAQFACRPVETADAFGQPFPPESAALIGCSLAYSVP